MIRSFSKYPVSALLVLIIGLPITLIAQQQNRAQLNAERLRINEEIETTENLLNLASDTKATTLSKINALELQIDARTRLIENMRNEALVIEESKKSNIVEKQQVDAASEELSEEYYEILRIQYRNKLLKGDRRLLANSTDLRTYLTKHRYLEIYKDLVKYKANDLTDMYAQSSDYSESISTLTKSQEELITEQIDEKLQLEEEMERLISSAKNMTVEEQSMKQKLDNQHREREEYNQAIEALLISSLKNQTLNNNQINSAKSTDASTLAEILDIERKKGFLPYPVSDYTVTKIFGLQPHADIPGINIDNKGLDLATNNLQVNAIYKGVVTGISEVSANNIAVIINHGGDYYSAYSGLNKVQVSKGVNVSTGQSLGLLHPTANGTGNLHFEFYKGRQRMNPKHWLKNN